MKVKSFRYQIEWEDGSRFGDGTLLESGDITNEELLKHILNLIEKLSKRETAPTIREV